ncbi:hypothetical protein GH742_06760 [Legionella sp. MW5194]|nr:hypothetical protein [Legionella sp. MW5194]QRN03585.1 hypothetical protein GH742_06760 [Legionella sp. MW5194]
MKKTKNTDPAEIREIKNICDVSPQAKEAKGVCQVVNRNKKAIQPKK